MKSSWLFVLLFLTTVFISKGQGNFNYSLELKPVSVPNLPGLHSFAFAENNGMWLIIGGRKDGLHARQPFASFPAAQNNTDIYVIDVNTQQFWYAPLASLPIPMSEQLQSTNMNFYQDGDTLILIGGYAFSTTANDHITFPNMTTVLVPDVINAIINGSSIAPFFKQITDNNFAVTGGQLGKIDNTFFLVGGQRFDGRYNPMNGPTFVQTYTDQIRKFTIDNSGSQLSYSNYSAITDPVHLHRRDYNLLPQIFPDGTQGYTISSGVFQVAVDLPFLYPVDITANGYMPITSFNQYLSNYHSAKSELYDSISNSMHTLFFGGISQYYFQNGILIQDNDVPFVKTISRLTRNSDSTLTEYQLPVEMPALKGSSAEFIPNLSLPHYESSIIKLSQINQDSILIGHIYGGISSPSLNPFTANQTGITSADNTIYEVWLIDTVTVGIQTIDGKNPYDFKIYPNPADSHIYVNFQLSGTVKIYYFITSSAGQIIQQGEFGKLQTGNNTAKLNIDPSTKTQTLFVTLVFDDKYYVTKRLQKHLLH